jgi:hypothetical protein
VPAGGLDGCPYLLPTLRECVPLAAPEPARRRLQFGNDVKPLLDTKGS